ncbi:MAG TPA: LPXTG cell wall anchor domain-containing protein [Oscillospiraceae bacterium]|jgi:LPXTG-motif cell wall-anchored protein|nr:LPXTG cell wall anchor domain-containing protein [Oscillospiraceae bacterium]HRW56432.1 LPXTG cell wall anchor domain-containing protein [Oscillospiraceae bacterium]
MKKRFFALYETLILLLAGAMNTYAAPLNPETGGDRTLLFIVIGVAVFSALGILVFVLMGKKR